MLLETARDKKETGTFTNVEENVYRGLQDAPTVEELCVLSLYSQAVTYPYLWFVRGAEGLAMNAIDLGPLHARLQTFLQCIIENPDILLAPDATYETGSFDGKIWE